MRIKANILKLVISVAMAFFTTPLLVKNGSDFYGTYILLMTTLGFSIWIDDAIRHYLIALFGSHYKGELNFIVIRKYVLFLVISCVICVILFSFVFDSYNMAIMFLGINIGNLVNIYYLPLFIKLLSNGEYFKYNISTLIVRFSVLIAGLSLLLDISNNKYFQFSLVYFLSIFMASFLLSKMSVSCSYDKESGDVSLRYYFSFIKSVLLTLFYNTNLLGLAIINNIFIYYYFGVKGNAIFGVGFVYASYIRMISGVISFGFDSISSHSKKSLVKSGIYSIFFIVTPSALVFIYYGKFIIKLWLTGIGTIPLPDTYKEIVEVSILLVNVGIMTSYLDILQKELAGKNMHHIYGIQSFYFNVLYLVSLILFSVFISDVTILNLALIYILFSYLICVRVVYKSINNTREKISSIVIINVSLLLSYVVIKVS